MAEDLRERILKAAGDLFMKYGVNNITMDDIAGALSISKKTIYQFFRDKNDIVCISTRNFLECEKASMEKLHRESENIIEKMFLITVYYREIITRINPSIIYDLKRHFPEAWEIYLDYKRNIFYNSISEALHLGVKEGLFRKDFNIDILTTLRLEQFQLAFDEEIFPRNTYDFREVQDQLFLHYLYGIVTDKGKLLLEKHINTHNIHEPVK